MKPTHFLTSCLHGALLVFAFTGWLFATAVRAQTFEPVHAWSNLGGPPTEPLIRASDGNYYGTVPNGGPTQDGGVVRVEPGGHVTMLYAFSYLRSGDGYRPNGGLVQGSDGFLYGVNSSGGMGNDGTYFRISLAGEFTKLANFVYANGTRPEAALVGGPDGNFYGVAFEGGANNRGTIFRATPTGVITAVYSFPATGPGAPSSPLIRGDDGALYGIAGYQGVFYRYTPAAGYEPLHTFTPAEGAGFTTHLVKGTDGHFYGVSFAGGTGKGTVFKITPQGVVTVLHTFNGTNGEGPQTGLCAASDGLYYGVTRYGGTSNKGTIFRLSAAGPVSVLHSFNGTDGVDPMSPVTETPLGLMVGVNTSSTSYRPLYRLAPTGALTVIGRFDGSDGVSPTDGLVEDASGNFYGTTSGSGGATIFKITPAGQRTVLHRFTSATGTSPTGPLALGPDGNFYGVAGRDGPNGKGVIYRITPAGVHTVIHSFQATGTFNPEGGLALGNDGNFYGTTAQSGTGGGGQFYRVTPAGVITFLGEFTSATGRNPQGTLVKDAAGFFFGTATYNGTGGAGTIFRVLPDGAILPLHHFDEVNGGQPFAGLWRRDDGTFFGTTYTGGQGDSGVIFRLTAGGAYSVLSHCYSLDGSGPLAPPVGVPDGRLYGTTSDGGQYNDGLIYRIAANNTVSVFRSFGGTSASALDGVSPAAPFHFASDGNLYGLTSHGGRGGGGTMFRLRFGASPKTLPATDLTTTSVTLHGTVNPNGADTNATFEWGTAPDALSNSTTSSSVGAGSAAVAVSAPLSGLAPEQVYYYRLRADNAQQFAPQRGEVLTFITTTATAPIVTTTSVTSITPNSAELSGKVTARGQVVSTFFERADRPTEAQWLPGVPPSVAGNVVNFPFTATATGLLPHTSYTVRAIARDAATAFGDSVTFTTATTPPVAVLDLRHPTSPQVTLNPTLNDTDADGDTLTVTAVANGSLGTAALSGPNTITYTGGPGFTGNDSFTYTISDGFGGTAQGTVVLQNASPTAGDITRHSDIGPGGTTTFDVAGVITDADGDALRIVRTMNGSPVSFDGTTVTFGPADASFNGNLSIEYTISDGAGAEAGGTLMLTNAAPTAANLSMHASFGPDGGTTIDVTSLVADADGDPLSVVGVSSAAHGNVTFSGLLVTYANASAAFTGNDALMFTVSDGRGGKATATITFTNGAPIAMNDTLSLDAPGATLDVLANDSDPDGDPLTIVAAAGASLGTVTTDGATITYAPGADFEGADSFTYTITDGRGAVATATVTLKADFPVARILALSGEPVPGEAETTWRRFGVPSLLQAGQSAGWLATVRGPDGTARGVFQGPLGAPAWRLRNGDAVPDSTGAPLLGLRFTRFAEPVFAGENFAVAAKAAGPRSAPAKSGLWVNEAGALKMVFASGSPAPGTTNARFDRVQAVLMPTPDCIFFAARLRFQPTSVSARTDDGVWAWESATGVRLLLREGQTLNLPGGPAVVRGILLPGADAKVAGHGGYASGARTIEAMLRLSDSTVAAVRLHADGQVETLARSGQPDVTGRNVRSLGLPASPGMGMGPFARAEFREEGVTICDLATGRLLARVGDPAATADGALFAALGHPIAGFDASSNATAFFASAATGPKSARRGVWEEVQIAGQPTLRLVALAGAEPPGATGTAFAKFEALTVVDGLGSTFVARLASGAEKVTRANDRGCWARATDGSLRLLLREGAPLAGRTMRAFDLLGTVPGSPAQRRAWASGANPPALLARVHFTDGESALVKVIVP